MTDFKRIGPDEAARLFDQGANVVDVRDAQSFASGHIPSAIRLDNTNLPQYLADTDRSTPLVVCCYHGNSSQSAAAYLASAGFAEVYSLDGGFDLWHREYPEQVTRD
ncbi:thiosulfate sulfurtransferase GlpE [Pseudomonas saliphila]|uniref:thiosulfate sulfurtransferase GlpE n=1 Tax=Pseudomonas saliphila TaxID=2586906 RepID=UPI001238DFDD|nr:thiosulfate sulfurtransferase GlpE [Pseudomonas saliphila]